MSEAGASGTGNRTVKHNLTETGTIGHQRAIEMADKSVKFNFLYCIVVTKQSPRHIVNIAERYLFQISESIILEATDHSNIRDMNRLCITWIHKAVRKQLIPVTYRGSEIFG